jgi:hypothetical protein
MGRQRPTAVSNAIRAQWALVAASAALTLLTVVMREDLLRDWAEPRGGLEFVRESQLSIPSFGPVALVSFVVYAALAWVLVVMFQHGHGWARWSLLALAVSFLFATVVIARASPPVPFLVLCAVVAVLDLALMWFLLRRTCGEWIRGSVLAEDNGDLA